MPIKQLFKNQNLHIQKLNYTCGPVSLLNVLAAKGAAGNHSEESLAQLCGAKPGFGTSNEAMVETAGKLGLEVLEAAESADLGQVEEYLDRGACVIVCYLCLSGGGHYAVATEHDEAALYFLDCTHGLLRIEKDNFIGRWRNKHEPTERWFMAIA